MENADRIFEVYKDIFRILQEKLDCQNWCDLLKDLIKNKYFFNLSDKILTKSEYCTVIDAVKSLDNIQISIKEKQTLNELIYIFLLNTLNEFLINKKMENATTIVDINSKGIMTLNISGEWSVRDFKNLLINIDNCYNIGILKNNFKSYTIINNSLEIDDISNELRINKLQFNSPGSQEFVGLLNPLNLICDLITKLVNIYFNFKIKMFDLKDREIQYRQAQLAFITKCIEGYDDLKIKTKGKYQLEQLLNEFYNSIAENIVADKIIGSNIKLSSNEFPDEQNVFLPYTT